MSTLARRQCRRFAVGGNLLMVVVVFATTPPSLEASLPPSWHTPGPTQGETATRWVAPYVRQSLEGVIDEPAAESCCCGPGRHTVRWYREDGQIEFELADDGLSASLGYVRQSTDTTEAIYYGIIPRWRTVLPQKSRIESSVAASRTGDLFVHQFYPDSGHVSLDVYREGRFERTLGPYPGKPGQNPIRVESWGSIAMATCFDHGEDRISAVTYGRDGEFLIPVPTTTMEAHASPSGRRAVFQYHSIMAIVDADGHRVDLVDRGSPLAVLWGQDETELMVIARRGDAYTCVLIDVSSERVQWEVPVEGLLDWDGPAALVKGLLLIASTGHRDAMHCYRVQALDWKTGQLVADWGGTRWTGEWRGQPKLMSVGDQVYYVDDRRFSRINIDDIREQRFGWTLTEP